MAFLLWKNTVVLQHGWTNGEFFYLKKKSNISWEWCLKHLLQKPVRIRNHRSGNSTGRVLAVERGFPGLVESQREPRPRGSRHAVCMGWQFQKWSLFRVNWQEKGRRHGETVRKSIFEYKTRPESRGFRKWGRESGF